MVKGTGSFSDFPSPCPNLPLRSHVPQQAGVGELTGHSPAMNKFTTLLPELPASGLNKKHAALPVLVTSLLAIFRQCGCAH